MTTRGLAGLNSQAGGEEGGHLPKQMGDARDPGLGLSWDWFQDYARLGNEATMHDPRADSSVEEGRSHRRS